MKLDLAIGAPAVRAQLTGFVKDYVRRSGAKGVVVGLSGGLDSALVMALCAEALGARKVRGLVMPAASSRPLDEKHARLAAEKWGVAVEEVRVAGIVDGLLTSCKHPPKGIAAANAQARARMMVLYYHANTLGSLVAGTGNKSELLTGYFTKHGDGAGDVHPIGDLYKTQVRALAAEMRIPKPILTKTPTAGLWAGQTDEKELGIRYAKLDLVLHGIELMMHPESIAESAGVSLAEVGRIRRMVERSQHKRQGLVVPKVGFRTPGLDWRAPPSRGA